LIEPCTCPKSFIPVYRNETHRKGGWLDAGITLNLPNSIC
jgi:hypothetical protein